MGALEILIVSEIVFVNILTIYRCCKRKYGMIINIPVILLFSAMVFTIGYLFINKLGIYGNGNGLFVIFGFLYLIPLKFLSNEKVSNLFIIICMAWGYTLGIFSLSVQIGKLFDIEYLYRNVFLIESSLFIIFTVPFNKIIVKKYIYILKNSREKNNNWHIYLAATSIMYFFTILGINFVFTMEKGSIIKVFVILFLILTMFFTYIILYQMIKHGNKINILNHTAHHDELTGLYNRLSLFNDLNDILKTQQTFSVLFMDLDKFKEINDKYGHITGDQYLKHFAKIISEIIKDKGSIYRFGGDEFLAIYDGIVPKETIKSLQQCKSWNINAPCPFNNVSIGVQICKPPHMDIENLLEQVDKEMYYKKMEKKV